jgi:hypothetical protein
MFKNPLIMKIAGVTAMLVAIAVVLFSGAPGINKAAIEAHLRHFSEYVAKEAAESGKEIKLTHGDIRIAGWGYNKRGVIGNVSLELVEKSSMGATSRSFSTAAVQVKPDHSASGRMVFVFAEPIHIAENGQPKTVITSSAPLRYAYFNGPARKLPEIVHTLLLPNEIILMNAETGETPWEGAGTVITYDSDPLVEARFLPEKRERSFVYAFHNLRVTEQRSGRETSVASLSSDFHETQGEDKRVSGKYELMIADMAVWEGEKSSRPYSLSADINYHGDAPDFDLGALAPNFGNTDVTVNHIRLMGDEFKINASGTVTLASDDPLPSGKLAVVMENAGKFIESDLISDEWRSTVSQALQQVSGQPIDPAAQLEFALKREKNGVFYVGKTTFEALAAAILADLLKLPGQFPAPTPPAEAPSPGETPPPAADTPTPETATP